MATRLASYGYINAKLRARLGNALEDPDFTALLEAKDPAEFARLLEDTEYREAAAVFADTGNIRLTEAALFKTEVTLFEDIAERIAGPPGDFVSALLSRYEIETLKRALRLWFEKHVKQRDVTDEIGYLYTGFTRLKPGELVDAGSLEAIVELLAHTPYGQVIDDVRLRDFSQFRLFPFETALDNCFFTGLEGAIDGLSKSDGMIAKKIIGVEIDLENLERIVRFKDLYGHSNDKIAEYLIPSGAFFGSANLERGTADIIKTYVTSHYAGIAPILDAAGKEKYSNLILLEAVLNEVLTLEVKRALLGYPFSIGIILAYVFLKRREVRRIIGIVNAKAYGIEADRLRDLP
jgi:V/A-type H+-transporting ATPase subunit C